MYQSMHVGAAELLRKAPQIEADSRHSEAR